MDNVVINITELPNNVSFQITEDTDNVTINIIEGGGGMQCADLAACQTIIDIEADLNTVASDLAAHESNTSNPHNVTKAQVGLSNVDNTSDINKPVSTAQQTALNLKEDLANKVTNFTSPNNTDYATTQATINLVDNRVQSNIKIIGDWDASSGSYPLADESNTTPFVAQWGAVIKQGFAFRVGYGQSGTVDGFDYENGDVVYALIDNPTDNATDWGDLDHNLQQADESLRGTAKIVTAAIIADETSTDDERMVTTKKLWANFLTRVLAIAHTFAAKITFTSAPRFSSVSASQYLKVNANKDLTSSATIPMSDINITVTDYAPTSTINGFSSFTTKIIQVIDMGAYDLINFDLAGTSNATIINFTVPNALSASAPNVSAIIHSLSAATNGSGLAQLSVGSTQVNCYFNVSSAVWGATGLKRVRGTFTVQK